MPERRQRSETAAKAFPMAKKYPYNRSVAALLHPAEGATFFEDWRREEIVPDKYDMLCAEMARLAYAASRDVPEALDKIRFKVDGFFGGETPAGRFKTKGTQGFVASDAEKKITVLAFRGTESGAVEDLVADL